MSFNNANPYHTVDRSKLVCEIRSDVRINSYRANGGGELLTRGAGIPQDSLESRVLFHTDLDQRHYLTEEIKRLGTINPQKNNNWKFVPEAWVKPALERDRKQLFGK